MQTEVCWGLEGCLKAEKVAIALSLPPHIRITTSKFDAKFLTANFSQFLFSHLEASYEMYEKLHHTKTSCYAVYGICRNMMGGHGVSLKACSKVSYAFRKRESVIDNLVHYVHNLRNVLRSQVAGRLRIYKWSL